MSGKQNFAAVLNDLRAINRIKKWVHEKQAGMSPSISASELAIELGDSELQREINALVVLNAQSAKTLCAGVQETIRTKRVRKRLFPELAVLVFGIDMHEQLNTLISSAGLTSALNELSTPVNSLIRVCDATGGAHQEQGVALLKAADALFYALDAVDEERQLIILRIVCLLHLGFRWDSEVKYCGSDVMSRLCARFFEYLKVPGSARSIDRLKSVVKGVVSKINESEEPETVLMSDYINWWQSLFHVINCRGRELLVEFSSELKLLPGNPFCLTDGDQSRERKDVSKHTDPVTEAAKALRGAESTVRPKMIARKFRSLSKGMEVLDYDLYDDLDQTDLGELHAESQAVEEKARGVRMLIENTIQRNDLKADGNQNNTGSEPSKEADL
ncbi:MAG: hypothetical protein ACSHYA_11885 [Opitutaceae bacterium]